jgi:hypothetical protein
MSFNAREIERANCKVDFVIVKLFFDLLERE